MSDGKAMFSDQLAATRGRPAGFDYMRLGLSVAVVVMHSAITSYGVAADLALWASPARSLLRAILPMFFVLSGFLVAGSLERCRTLMMFVGLRAIRIYPALAVEVLLSAFLIGPFVTTMPLLGYFTDPLFLRYLVNVTGHISYRLPGVFASAPLPDTVNAQLWTVPYELYCYAVLVFIALIGLRKWRILAPLALGGVCVVHLLARLYRHGGHYEQILGAPPGPLLVAYYLAGVTLYLYRDRIRFSGTIAAVMAVLAAVALYNVPLGEYLAIPPIGYLTAYLGLCDPRRSRLLRGADYSYGIYLYGFVIQQLVMSTMPGLRHWWLNLLVCLPLSALCAAASWHLVEKPAMRLKPLLVRIEARWLRAHGAVLGLIRRAGPAAAGAVPPPARMP